MDRKIISVNSVRETSARCHDHRAGKESVNWLRITRTVEETCFVPVMSGRCERCGAAFPDIRLDAHALNFVLDNHDGMRVVFPGPANTQPERDTYPATGVVKINGALCCGACADEFQLFMLAGRAGKGGR